MKLTRAVSFAWLTTGLLAAALLALPGVAAAAPHTAAQEAESAQIGTLLEVLKKSPPHAKPLANPGEVCNTNGYMVVDNYYGEVDYVAAPNTPMRIEAYEGPSLYYGHEEYNINGYFLRSKINQSTCHKT